MGAAGFAKTPKFNRSPSERLACAPRSNEQDREDESFSVMAVVVAFHGNGRSASRHPFRQGVVPKTMRLLSGNSWMALMNDEG